MPAMAITNSFGLAAAKADRVNINLFAPTVGLFQNDVTPGPTTQLGDLVEADYDGYAPINSTFGPVFSDGLGAWQSIQTKQFDSVPSAGSTNIVYGVFVTNTLNLLMAAGKLATPVPMGAVAQSLVAELIRKSNLLTLTQLP